MSQIPQAILDMISKYAQGNQGLADIIEAATKGYTEFHVNTPYSPSSYGAALASCVVNAIDPSAIVLMAQQKNMIAKAVVKQRNPILMAQAQVMQAPTQVSPHAPVAKGKRPYWIKVVTSYDPNVPNGYGVKGKFVNPDQLHHEQDDAIVVVQTKDKNAKLLSLFRVKHGASSVFKFPNGTSIDLPNSECLSGRITDYPALYQSLAHHGIPVTV